MLSILISVLHVGMKNCIINTTAFILGKIYNFIFTVEAKGIIINDQIYLDKFDKHGHETSLSDVLHESMCSIRLFCC